MQRPSLPALAFLAALGTAACGIRSPSQQCQIALSREVACGQLAADQAASTKATCQASLAASSKDCQHAFDALVGCLDGYSCYDLDSGACDDLYGDAAPVCPLMFGGNNYGTPTEPNAIQPKASWAAPG